MGKPGRKPALTPAQRSRLQDRIADGASDAVLTRELGVSRRTVARHRAALRAVPARGGTPYVAAPDGASVPAPARRRSSGRRSSGEGGASEAEPGSTAMDLDEHRSLLSRLLRDTIADAERLRAEGEDQRATSATRLAGALSSALRHITRPDPPPDPNELPDMIAAAERGVERLKEYQRKIRSGK
jgi:hypothetical protein